MARVSVIMPVCNAGAYLEQAVRSVLGQTLADFELLIMDDGSTDHSPAIAERLARADPRIRFLPRARRGLVASLNELVELAEAPYIARMDADDLCLPERLARQVEHMDGNPETGVLGCWVETFGEKNEVWHFRRWDNYSRNLLFFGVTVLCHPSWMVRRELYRKHPYDPAFEHIEDREWLARVAASERQIRFRALPEVLLRYRIHATSVTGRHREHQLRLTGDIVARLLRSYGIDLVEQDLLAYLKVCRLEPAGLDEVRTSGEVVQRVRDRLAGMMEDEYKVFPEFWLKFCAANRVDRETALRYVRDESIEFLGPYAERPATR